MLPLRVFRCYCSKTFLEPAVLLLWNSSTQEWIFAFIFKTINSSMCKTSCKSSLQRQKNIRLPYPRPLSSSIHHLLPHFFFLFVVQQQFLWSCAGVTCKCMPLCTHMNRLKIYRSGPFNSPIYSQLFLFLHIFSFLFPFLFICPPSLLVFYNAVQCLDILNPGLAAVFSCSHCQCILTLSTVTAFCGAGATGRSLWPPWCYL